MAQNHDSYRKLLGLEYALEHRFVKVISQGSYDLIYMNAGSWIYHSGHH